MSFDILDKLEQKIKELVEKNAYLDIELEGLKEEKNKLLAEKEELLKVKETIAAEHEQLKEKLAVLLSKFENY